MLNKSRLYSAIIISLLFIIFCSFPFSLFIKDANLVFWLSLGLKLIFIVILFLYIHKEKLSHPHFCKAKLSWLIYIPFVVICGSNLFVPIFSSELNQITFDGLSFVKSAALSIVTAFIEEMIFRVIILGEFREYQNNVKSILFTSLIFGACHLLNINSVASILPCVIQAIYTFLFGILLGYMYVDTDNFIMPFIFHTLFNLLNKDLTTSLFNLPYNTIFYVVNIIIGVIFALYFVAIILYRKYKLKQTL